MTDIASVLAPSGRLRAVVNIHNSLLAPRHAETDVLSGLPVDLACALAERLRLPLQLLPVSGAAAAFGLISQCKADIGFLAVDASRAANVDFTTPFIQFDATYMAPPGRLASVAGADVAGNRIAVLQGSGPDLHLSKVLANAMLVRRPSPDETLDAMLSGEADIMAGNRHALDAMAATHAGLTVSDDAFLTVRQAICLPKGRQGGQAYASDFVEEMKATGMVAAALRRTGMDGALAPPPRLP